MTAARAVAKTTQFSEDTVELAAIDWLREVGYDYVHGGVIAPGEPAAERTSYNEVLLVDRLRAALERINGHIPRSVRASVVDEVIRRIQRTPARIRSSTIMPFTAC